MRFWIFALSVAAGKRAKASVGWVVGSEIAPRNSSVRTRRKSLLLALVVVANVAAALSHARLVEARTLSTENMLQTRFFSELAVPDSANDAFLQAAAKAKTKPVPPVTPLPEGKGKDLAQKYCGTCHATTVWTVQHHTADQWSSIMDTMVSKGMNASEEDSDTITAYLAEHFGPVVKGSSTPVPPEAAPSPSPSIPPHPVPVLKETPSQSAKTATDLSMAKAGQGIFSQRCMQCHSVNEGQVMLGPSLYKVTKKPQGKKTDAQIRLILKNGKGKMPSFQDKLSADDINRILAYLHTL